MDLNKLYEQYPHLFQFMVKDFESASEEQGPEGVKAIFHPFNSARGTSYPFYKSISKIIPPAHDTERNDV